MTVVDISLLLESLDETLHANVASAANARQYATFPSLAVWNAGPAQRSLNMREADVNGVFTAPPPLEPGDPPPPTTYLDCIGMQRVIMARALIVTVAGNSLQFKHEFDALGFTTGSLTQYWNDPHYVMTLNQMRVGDVAMFNNFEYDTYFTTHPLTSGWQSENVIKVAQDLYYGFDKAPQSWAGGRATLAAGWNTDKNPGVATVVTPDQITFNGRVRFFEVANLVAKVFAERKAELSRYVQEHNL